MKEMKHRCLIYNRKDKFFPLLRDSFRKHRGIWSILKLLRSFIIRNMIFFSCILHKCEKLIGDLQLFEEIESELPELSVEKCYLGCSNDMYTRPMYLETQDRGILDSEVTVLNLEHNVDRVWYLLILVLSILLTTPMILLIMPKSVLKII